VDFADILSWVAVMKASHNRHDSISFLSWSSLQNGVRLVTRQVNFSKFYLWLAFGCLLRDIVVPKHRKVIKSSSVRLLGSISLVLYMLSLRSGQSDARDGAAPRLSPLQQALTMAKQVFL
jgi:hypothetical protein